MQNGILTKSNIDTGLRHFDKNPLATLCSLGDFFGADSLSLKTVIDGKLGAHWFTVADGFPDEPGVYGMNTFLGALLQKSSELGDESYPSTYMSHLVALLGYEIASLEELPLGLPLPLDRRARNIADQLMKCPSSELTQEQLASHWGVSVRTLSRIFIKQTGMTFSQWRQQSKIITSLKLIQEGLTIAEVAERSGYSNVSAYIEAFRQRFGETPGKFQSKAL